MKLIRPLTLGADGFGLTGAMLTASSISEPDTGETTWNAATNYTTGTEAIRTGTHRKYKRLAPGGVSAALPEATPTEWEDIGPTNKWAMFDKVIGTASTDTTTLSCTVVPGMLVNTVSLLGLVGASVSVVMKDTPGGTTVYSRTVGLASDETVTDWYEYFFSSITGRSTLTLTDLPPYLTAEIVVTITGTGTVECGTCYFGNYFELGDTQYGTAVGIIDYSSKAVDADTGRITVTEGPYRDRAQVALRLPSGRVDMVKRTLTSYRATPVMWVGVDDQFEALTLFGFYRDFSVVIAYQPISTCSLEIEGLV